MAKQSLKEKALALSNGLEIMEGREKKDLADLIGEVVTINNFDFMKSTDDDGNPTTYVVFTIDQDDDGFYFGGKVLTEKLHELENDGYKDEVLDDGLPTLFGKKKSTKGKKKEYTTVAFYPEAEEIPEKKEASKGKKTGSNKKADPAE